ncbi:MAG: murein biosynthesis integral membrane protein MurJ [Propionibacteriaceae bacterium]|nr:murein biosynthesis integral membrane protein MurJ [Propionibacteriaceae bacterium]
MAEPEKVFKTTILLSLVIVLSKIVGFVREAVLAAQFGQTVEKSAYLASFNIVYIFTILFSIGTSASFIPIYSKIRLDSGEKPAGVFASNVLNLYILCAIIASGLGVLLAPQFGAIVWDGSPEGLALVIDMTRRIIPFLMFWAVAGVLANLLNARKHFLPEQLMGFALSFCVIIACLIFDDIRMVALIAGCSAAVQILILLPFLKGRFHYRAKLNLKDADLRRMFMLAIPGFISAAFDELNTIVDTRFSSAMGDNAPSAIGESFRIGQPIMGILIVPITTVMYTRLSRFAAKNDTDGMKKTIRVSIETIALITLPVIVIAYLLQTDIVALLFERGEYTHANTLYTAPVFAFYIIGLIGYGLRSFFARVFYALQKTRIPMLLGIIAVVINIILDIVLKDVLYARGLTLATSIASVTCAIMMVAVLRKHIGRMGLKKVAGQFLRILVCAAVCAGVVFLLFNYLALPGERFVDRLARLACYGTLGLVTYALAAYLLKVEVMRKMLLSAKQKLFRKR